MSKANKRTAAEIKFMRLFLNLSLLFFPTAGFALGYCISSSCRPPGVTDVELVRDLARAQAPFDAWKFLIALSEPDPVHDTAQATCQAVIAHLHRLYRFSDRAKLSKSFPHNFDAGFHVLSKRCGKGGVTEINSWLRSPPAAFRSNPKLAVGIRRDAAKALGQSESPEAIQRLQEAAVAIDEATLNAAIKLALDTACKAQKVHPCRDSP
jgi:hypothetical protein